MAKSHISLYVSDLEASQAFYSAFLGQAPVKSKADYAKFELAEPALVLSLVQNPARVQSQFGHLGLVLERTEQVNQWQAAAESRGVAIALVETGTRCCYALQDKFWVKDPDGVQWEVYTFHEDSEWNDPAYSAAENSQPAAEAVCCAG
ncbi:MAG: VOC family protein [Candidatus Sericytochromatia bacterium]|nr:VOC family protein [Candidatus Sericytochromatia bacterium]